MESIQSKDQATELSKNIMGSRYWLSVALKRMFDFSASALGLLILSPIFAFIAILIKRDSPGPVFYRGPRLGMGGKPFGILKFRTMREEAASYEGPKVTAEGDQRITPLGKWLRDSKLNELPQLWNVFVGQMSLVGPRPEDPSLALTWPRDVRAEVLSVRPGITSPASVLFRDEEKMLSASNLMSTYLGEILPSKLRLDQLYVRHHSFLLDLDVLFWTFLVVMIPSLRNHKPPEDTLFWGPISRIGRRYVNWFVIDTLITFIAFGFVGGIERIAIAPLNIGLFLSILIAFIYSLLFSSIAALLGVQKISWSSASAIDALELVPPVFLSFLASWAVNAWMSFHLPFHVILDTSILAFFGYVFTRYRSRILTGVFSRWVTLRKNSFLVRERVLIVGAGDTGQFVAWRLSHNHESSNYQIVGFVDDDMFSQGVRLNGYAVLGKRESIAELVEKHDIGVIIFAIHNISPLERKSILKKCRKTKAHVVIWPDAVSLIRMKPSKKDGSGKAQILRSAEESPEYKKMLDWLDVLETNLNEGDYDQVMEHIYSMRSTLLEKDLDEVAEA